MRRPGSRRTLQQRKVHMKKSFLITTLTILSLTVLGGFAQAQTSSGYTSDRDRQEFRDRRNHRDREDDRSDYRSDYRQLRGEIDQLNIMFARVNSHLRTFGAGRQIRWEYSRLLRDRDRLNYELERRPLDRLRVHAQIERVRDQLRDIEVRLRVRGGRHFQR